MVSRRLLLFVAVVPVIAVTAAYLLGVRGEILPRCVPFFEGCTSISATGRYPPGSYVFKPVFLLQSALLLWCWFSVTGFLRRQGNGLSPALAKTIEISALVASLALIVYTVTLGSKMPLYEFMRRFGIYLYFIGTVICQIGTTASLRSIGPRVRRPVRAMSMIVMAPFLLGAANFYLKATLDDPDAWENRIEWCAALLMQAWFLGLYAVTRRLTGR